MDVGNNELRNSYVSGLHRKLTLSPSRWRVEDSHKYHFTNIASSNATPTDYTYFPNPFFTTVHTSFALMFIYWKTLSLQSQSDNRCHNAQSQKLVLIVFRSVSTKCFKWMFCRNFLYEASFLRKLIKFDLSFILGIKLDRYEPKLNSLKFCLHLRCQI
jgi:hypothetical protein